MKNAFIQLLISAFKSVFFNNTLLLAVCFIVVFIIPNIVFAENFSPIVVQFTKKDYSAGNQNWSVAQDNNGFIYFGNNDGLLRYDGLNFKLIRLPNHQTIRSVYIDKNNRIYVGSFREFGYFESDEFGKLNYTSISSQLVDYNMENDEIWKIIEFENKVFFQSFKSIFIFDGKTIKGKSYDQSFLYFFAFQNQLYLHTLRDGFSKFDYKTNQFEVLQNVPFKSSVISIVPFSKNKAYVITQNDGIFIFNGNSYTHFGDNNLDFLKKVGTNNGVLSKDSLLIVGTITDGVVAIDKFGKKKWHLNTSNNLQNNTVLGLYCDNENNLWAALDKGFAMVRLNSPLQFIQNFTSSIGAIYSVNLQPNTNKLYIGSNQGLYSANFNPTNNSITEITNDPIIKGQVWDLIAYDGQLFCGNNDETYQILPSKKILSYAHGGMTIAKGVLHNKDVLVQGTYSDVCIYTRNGNNWQFNSIINNFIHPIKSIEIDYQGRIWAAHMHQGLFLIKLADDLKTTQTIEKFDYFENQNLKQINVSKINNRVVFSDNSQFYIYNDIDKKIVPFNDLNNALGKFKSAYKVVMQSPSNYWFIRKDEAALFYITETSTILKDRVQFSLFQNQIVDNFQNIFPISDDKAFFTLENGLILYSSNHSKPFKTKKVDMFFSEIAILDKNSEIKEYTPVLTNKNSISLPYTKNRIKFSLSYPDFTHLNDLVFSYLLTGQNNKLSEVSQNNSIEYAYLAPGKYTFTAQVMNNNNELLATKKYEFQIRPPYYWNTYSKIFYALLIGVLLYLLLHYAKKREESKQQKLFEETEQNQKRELEKREQEIGKLKAEKLEAELTLKSKELATSTMTIIKKNEVLNRIKEELIITKQQIGTQFPNKYYDKIIKLLDENISSDDDWGIFQSNFDRIHDSFFRNLHTKYPNLTSNDLRFCAFFRLNLSTKDIANLMNISIKGVEVARYRIRKKLLIPSEKNIAEFFIEFK